MAKFLIKWPDGTEETEDCCDCQTLDNYMIRRFGGNETPAEVSLVEEVADAPAKAPAKKAAK